jgi:hypothetical protein
MPPEPPASAAADASAALARLLSALAALSVPPPGLAELQHRLSAAAADGPALPLEPLPLAQLGLDSLGRMEFCIHLELDHGVPLTPDRLLAMDELGELLAFLADPPGPPV